jgi:hypothetical protein
VETPQKNNPLAEKMNSRLSTLNRERCSPNEFFPQYDLCNGALHKVSSDSAQGMRQAHNFFRANPQMNLAS